jgi:hypothetical protein
VALFSERTKQVLLLSPAALLQALASYEASINIANISHDYDWIKVRGTRLVDVTVWFCSADALNM